MRLSDIVGRLFPPNPMPDVWFNEKKRTLLHVVRRMRWYKRIGGKQTPEEEFIAELVEMKKDAKNWSKDDEEALYGSEHEEAMFKLTLWERERKEKQKAEERAKIKDEVKAEMEAAAKAGTK